MSREKACVAKTKTNNETKTKPKLKNRDFDLQELKGETFLFEIFNFRIQFTCLNALFYYFLIFLKKMIVIFTKQISPNVISWVLSCKMM